ncbi:MAG: hypothetical protein NTY33_01930 [Candidatus Moranbacteria bacterium]|nr:hypothetical protein [Candidatus Moranbacteria bacterium]
MDFGLYKPQEEPSIWKSQVSFRLAIFVILILSVGVLWALHEHNKFITDKNNYPVAIFQKYEKKILPVGKPEKEVWHFVPGPISMDQIKKNGCVADGFLSGYGNKTGDIADMLNRSKCVYLHRALETWLRPPDFEKANEIMQTVTKRPVVYGMFLSEAISTWRRYSDPTWDHKFEFDKMCRGQDKDHWEKNSCIPSIDKPEYRRYLKSITHRAMDIGVQSFLFGQVELQDENPNFDSTQIKLVLEDMRSYAKQKNMQIIVGAQTNAITDEKYLRLFDYIEGGVGIDQNGAVENQPCFSKFSTCWALLWDRRYSSIANNVLLHLDWSGLTWDDMGIFARMDQDTRIKTLDSLYHKFTDQNMGFLMPFLAVLNHENDGCYGPNKSFYVPSKKYRCDDESAINKLMPNVKL